MSHGRPRTLSSPAQPTRVSSRENAARAGRVFKIQRWSIHDGDGIRSAVFLADCPLRCAWCANPECRAGADGGERLLSVDELMAVLRRDEVFYRESGGGVTFTGGEPFAQSAFLRLAARACADRGYRTAVETSAFFDWNECGDIVPLLGMVFADIKLMDSARHEQYTGVPNEPILENIGRIIAAHPRVVIRVPLVAGVNDSDADIEAMRAFVSRCSARAAGSVEIELLPYHNLGLSKYRALGLAPPDFAAPAPARVERLRRTLKFGLV